MLRFIEDDPDELAKYITSLGRGLVVFDGRPGAGKTHLARDVAKRVQCNSVDADAFLIRDQKEFLGARWVPYPLPARACPALRLHLHLPRKSC
jgi:predicted ATPase